MLQIIGNLVYADKLLGIRITHNGSLYDIPYDTLSEVNLKSFEWYRNIQLINHNNLLATQGEIVAGKYVGTLESNNPSYQHIIKGVKTILTDGKRIYGEPVSMLEIRGIEIKKDSFFKSSRLLRVVIDGVNYYDIPLDEFRLSNGTLEALSTAFPKQFKSISNNIIRKGSIYDDLIKDVELLLIQKIYTTEYNYTEYNRMESLTNARTYKTVVVDLTSQTLKELERFSYNFEFVTPNLGSLRQSFEQGNLANHKLLLMTTPYAVVGYALFTNYTSEQANNYMRRNREGFFRLPDGHPDVLFIEKMEIGKGCRYVGRGTALLNVLRKYNKPMFLQSTPTSMGFWLRSGFKTTASHGQWLITT